jgi:serine/threonine-protein kinase RsbW
MVARRFPRALGSLEAIVGFVHGFVAERGLDPELAYDLDLIVEELFTNLVRHEPGIHDIQIGLDTGNGRITVVIQDYDVDGYDLTQARPVDTGAPLEERRPGGLGIHFVKTIADDVRYEYADRTSTITVTKRIAS